MDKPALKQFGELTLNDFERHPVWVSCHVIDNDEPWYEETDEETFRPWIGSLPVDPAETMFLVRAEFQTANGRRLEGFLTPGEDENLGQIQPQVFIGSRRFGFWGGMRGVPAAERVSFYEALEARSEDVFPISFSASSGLASGVITGSLGGFYRRPDFKVAAVMEQ